MSSYRPAFPMIIAVYFFQLSGGILGLVTPLGLDKMGISLGAIGLIASLNAVGFMIGALTAPYWIKRLGFIRCFSFAAALACICCLCMDLYQNPIAWAGLRLAMGICFALMLTPIESWLGGALSIEQRGGVLSIYHLVAKVGLMVGPLLIIQYSTFASENFTLAGLFLAAALVPICITKQEEPPKPSFETTSFFKLMQIAPSAVVGVFLAGFINSSVLALLPVFMQSYVPLGDLTLYATLALGAVNIGGLLLQWPMGWLSDIVDRRIIVGLLAVIAGLAGLIIIAGADHVNPSTLLILLGVWGAGALVFYGICVAHGVDRSNESQITQMMALLLFIWAIGAVIGPMIVGIAMSSILGVKALFGINLVLHFGLAITMIVRNTKRKKPQLKNQEDWHPTLASTTAVIEIDPRNPDVQ